MPEVRGESLLRDREVAITGRLASMDRDEAITRITGAGGRYVETPNTETDLLVVGQAGWPLSSDGRLTRSLEVASTLQVAGSPITIVSEEDFLVSLGLQELQVGLHKLYTTEQLSRILDVPVPRIRLWMRNGLIEPVRVVRRLCWFDFRQVANVKALQRLQDSGATPARIRKSLDTLRALPGLDVGLTQLEALDDGSGIGVRLDDGRLAEPNGQLRLDFGIAGARAGITRADAFRSNEDVEGATQWFDRGIDAEEDGRLEDAVHAYMNALLAGGPQAETCFNLGNALYGLERHAEAMQRFLQAIEIDPEYVQAWNNLGNALAQLDRHSEAVEAYEQALAIEPAYATAHCNIAESLMQLGKTGEARAHWQRYLDHDPDSAWAQRIREMLRD